MAHKPQPDPAETSRQHRKANGPVQPPQPGFSKKPFRHEEQPEFKNVSKPVEEGEIISAFWRNVSGAFSLCHMVVVMSGEFSRTSTAKEWLGILERRMQWMREDEDKLEARLKTNVKYSHLVDDAELKRTCRLQEDRLRQLRSRAIEVVTERPSKAGKEYRDGETYDDKIQRTLRDVYDKCAKARKAFIRDVDAAVVNFMAAAEKERRKGGRGK